MMHDLPGVLTGRWGSLCKSKLTYLPSTRASKNRFFAWTYFPSIPPSALKDVVDLCLSLLFSGCLTFRSSATQWRQANLL